MTIAKPWKDWDYYLNGQNPDASGYHVTFYNTKLSTKGSND